MTRGSDLDPLELATGLVFGTAARPADRSAVPATPRATLEDAVARALERPPCGVSFSGGRDSSAILALAVHVARREGLSPPIALTHRFRGVDAAEESEWQERVVALLGLEDWARFEHDGELDCVGPIAQETLLRHGVLWPFNAFFHVPLLRAVRGGSLLTGIGGDEMLTGPRWPHLEEVLRGRARPQLRDAARVAYAAAPARIRRAYVRRSIPAVFGWLTETARREFRDRHARDLAGEPVGWARHADWVRRFRYLAVGLESLDRLATDDDVVAVHPFLDWGFVQALANLEPGVRYADREDAMRSLFADVLPGALISRSTKASFDAAFWNDASRAFAASWSGAGLDASYVDAEALTQEWSRDTPDPRSYLLAQAAWLAGAALNEPRRAGARRTPVVNPTFADA